MSSSQLTVSPPSDSAGRPRPADVYDGLQRLIVRGRLLPGARVTETGVAERLGVSRTPVREALHRLQQDGLLVPAAVPGTVSGAVSGTVSTSVPAPVTIASARTRLVVAPLQRDEMMELYHIAAALEGIAVRAVARQTDGTRHSVVTELQARNDRFAIEARRPLTERNLDDLFESHQAFHAWLIECGAGTQLKRQLAVIRPLVDRYEWFYAPLAGSNLEVSIDEHVAVVRAVRAGDPDASEVALRANWWNGAERLALAIDQVGDRGTW